MGRKLRLLFFFKTTQIRIGKNVVIHGLSYNLKVGNGTFFYDDCKFEFASNSVLSIGTHVIFSYGVILSCRKQIIIGNDVQIGEYTSIRDSTHQHKLDTKSMKYLPDIVDSVVIGNNVWIGRGCLIQPGTVIEDGVVVAANSVVKGRLLCNGVYGGAPVKLIKYRH